MAKLSTQARLGQPDDRYARLIEAYRDLDEAESHKLSAKLILLLANHIGDPEVLEEALAIARGEVSEI
jgi:hypothetical protein